jgi:hypothetical protein
MALQLSSRPLLLSLLVALLLRFSTCSETQPSNEAQATLTDTHSATELVCAICFYPSGSIGWGLEEEGLQVLKLQQVLASWVFAGCLVVVGEPCGVQARTAMPCTCLSTKPNRRRR